MLKSSLLEAIGIAIEDLQILDIQQMCKENAENLQHFYRVPQRTSIFGWHKRRMCLWVVCLSFEKTLPPPYLIYILNTFLVLHNPKGGDLGSSESLVLLTLARAI